MVEKFITFKITLKKADEDQSSLLVEMISFKEKAKPQNPEKKQEKKDVLENLRERERKTERARERETEREEREERESS